MTDPHDARQERAGREPWKAGVALDAEIARVVFSRKIERVTQGALSVLVQMKQDGSERGLIPAYSTDVAAAWLVVERMLDHDDQVAYLAFVKVWGEGCFVAPAYVAAERICRAALAALGTREEVDE